VHEPPVPPRCGRGGACGGWLLVMRVPGPYRWVEASGVRHAVVVELEFQQGDEVATLCGEVAVVRSHDPQRQCPFPTCLACNTTWRRELGLPILDPDTDPTPVRGAPR
jgi:zinc-finger